MTNIDLKQRLASSAFAFRGYNITNQGRSAELLAHPAYGPLVAEVLREASVLCSDANHRPVDLIQRIRERGETTLASFSEDVSLIVAMEVAQIRLLEQFFGIQYAGARLAFGYSLGEVAALICGGVFTMRDMLPPILAMCEDCVALAQDVVMGVLFSRGALLDLDAVNRLCLEINSRGQGVIAISAYLSPNTVLLLGQRDTVLEFRKRMDQVFPDRTYLRTNNHRWPPLHTPLLWQRNVSNRGAVMLHTISGGVTAPRPPIVSLVTGKMNYNDYNSRDIMHRWIDHPQRLWDAVYETLVSGVDTVIHVGPEPNLIPATFKRLSDNVLQQLSGRSLNSLGLRAMSGIARRPWLSKLLSSRTALLRAPYLQHIVLEDWLLAREAPS